MHTTHHLAFAHRAVIGFVAAGFFALAVTGLTVTPAYAAGRTIIDCAQHLDCGLDDIDAWSMPDRLRFVRGLQDGPVAAWLGHGFSDWHGIEGIIEFFRDNHRGLPGSWVSWTDAGILNGLERGTALALGTHRFPRWMTTIRQ